MTCWRAHGCCESDQFTAVLCDSHLDDIEFLTRFINDFLEKLDGLERS